MVYKIYNAVILFIVLFFFALATTFNSLLLGSFCFLLGSEKGTNAILFCVRVSLSDDSTAKDTIVARRCLEGTGLMLTRSEEDCGVDSSILETPFSSTV